MKSNVTKVFSTILVLLVVLTSVPMSGFAVNLICQSEGHLWGTYKTSVAATCTTQGKEVAECTRIACDAKNERVTAINRDNHNEINMPRVEPTCDRVGNEAGVVCGDCNAVISGYTKLPAKGHKAIPLAAVPATCTTDGNEAGTECEVCHTPLSGGKKIEKTGHRWEVYSKNPATCTTPGSQQDICKNCSTLSEVKVIESGHVYGSWRTVAAATCSAKGSMERTCQLCQNVETKEIDKLAHTPVWVDSKYPTCYEDGITEGEMCSVCGTILSGCTVIPKGHNFESFDITKKPTCTEDGLKYGYCLTCKKEVEEVILSTGHDWKLYSIKHATCTTAGEQVDICRNCSLLSEKKLLEASHSWGSWRTVIVATCSAEGAMERTCTFCQNVESRVIDKLAHTVEMVKAKEPSCTEHGTTAGKRCKVCKETIEGAVTIPAKGHTVVTVAGNKPTCDKTGTSDLSYCAVCGLILSESVKIQALGHNIVADTANSKNPTCTELGLDVRKCTRCNYTESKLLPVKHDADWYVISEAKCTKDGKQRGTCKNCGMDVTEVIPATGHTVNDLDWRTTKSPTCTAEGTKSATCTVCKKTATKSIPATGHNIVVKNPAVAPTCTTEGATESKHCSICKTVTTASQPVAKVAHTFGEWVVKSAPTCAVAGVEEATCKVCKTKETRVVDRLAHTEKEIPAVAATCTTSGSTAGIECTVCKYQIKKRVTIEPLGHNFESLKIAIEPTCEKEGLVRIFCTRCDAFNGEYVLSKINHKYEKDWQMIIAPTCLKEGVSIRICDTCEKIENKTLSVVPHNDANSDNKCDMCALDMSPANPADSCSCNCHKGGIVNFFFKFILVFQKIFGANRICACGNAHY